MPIAAAVVQLAGCVALSLHGGKPTPSLVARTIGPAAPILLPSAALAETVSVRVCLRCWRARACAQSCKSTWPRQTAAQTLPHAHWLRCVLLNRLSAARQAEIIFEPRGITPEDSVIFVIGCIPFVWAGIEFWRRIAVGDPFGTGVDSVIIEDSSGNRPKPVRRVLGQDAIIAARLLFFFAILSGLLVIPAAYDVLTTAGGGTS